MNSRCTSRPSLSEGRFGSSTGVGKGCRGGRGAALALSPGQAGVKVVGVMVGLRMYVFIDYSVARFGVTFQPIMTSNSRRAIRFDGCRSHNTVVAGASALPAAVAQFHRSTWRRELSCGDFGGGLILCILRHFAAEVFVARSH